jgi:hypothetical protein
MEVPPEEWARINKCGLALRKVKRIQIHDAFLDQHLGTEEVIRGGGWRLFSPNGWLWKGISVPWIRKLGVVVCDFVQCRLGGVNNLPPERMKCSRQ